MPSFAVNRKDANRGTGVTPGQWLFEEFMFTDSVFGTAKVSYRCDARKLAPSEIPEGDTSKPYLLEISDAVVTSLEVFDDDGVSLPIDESTLTPLSIIVLDAFSAIEDHVLDFERGLL
jgi:hypothetical protein